MIPVGAMQLTRHILNNTTYVCCEALRLEESGQKVLKLNIGNPAPFGFEAPSDILKDVIAQLPTAQPEEEEE